MKGSAAPRIIHSGVLLHSQKSNRYIRCTKIYKSGMHQAIIQKQSLALITREQVCKRFSIHWPTFNTLMFCIRTTLHFIQKCTFFLVKRKLRCMYYGSNNLTPGGLETNFEGGVILTLTFPEDADLFDQAMASFESLLPSSISCCVELTNTILQQLNNGGWLLDESIPKAVRNLGAIRRAGYTTSTPSLFAPYKTKLPKAISKTALAVAAASAGITTNPIGSGTPVTPVISHTAASPAVPIAIVEGLVMQVVPHHNGEIFLSMNAIRQNPGFFGFPFTGQTVPKKATNPTYPQRDPDPIVNIFVYDAAGTCVRTEIQYNLNTVFYEKKAEIRITITPSILRGLNYTGGSDYPIMVMRNSETDECDYDLHFYAKGSTDYSSCLSICDQALPSGGKPVARKMGWI